jgi:hypothetical protein
LLWLGLVNVKLKIKSESKSITKIIKAEVSFMNGWYIDDEDVTKACEKAAVKILKKLVV